MEPQFFNVINDELRGSKETHRVANPRTEELLWDAPVASAQDLDDAVSSALKAFPAWAKSTTAERQAALVKLGEVLRDHEEELTDILMKESGKSVLCLRGI